MKILRSLWVLLALLVSTHVFAMLPEGGWWYNPAESGRGYNIDIQDNVMGMSIYTFDNSGHPFYLMSAGRMSSDRQYTGPLELYSGGQCTGCPYRKPDHAVVGEVSITFDSPTTATLAMTGQAPIRIQRLAFGINMESPYPLLGEWAVVMGSVALPVYFGDRLTLRSTLRTNGTLMAMGSRSGASDRSVGGFEYERGQWAILVDSSKDYYTGYQVTFNGLNAIEGRSWTYLKTAEIQGAGVPFIGVRTQSAAAVMTGAGPGMENKRQAKAGAEDQMAAGARDHALEVQQQRSEPIDSELTKAAREAFRQILRSR